MENTEFTRDNGRKADQKRETSIEINYLKNNKASVLITTGNTKVLCAATTGNYMPPHVRDSSKGWISAEYSMLPSSSKDRIKRERNGAKGRTKEIERLIGRSLRSVCDLSCMPYESIIVDCDVIQADGGTRTASITGAFVALYILLKDLQQTGRISRSPVTDFMAAVSVGIVHGEALLDLNSYEDLVAQVDSNVIMTESGRLSEFQSTGEEATFTETNLQDMLSLAKKGISELITEQKRALGII